MRNRPRHAGREVVVDHWTHHTPSVLPVSMLAVFFLSDTASILAGSMSRRPTL
jgi:hypothetical protein